MKYCFGVDVGGTAIKIGLFDEEGNVLDKWEIATRTENNGSAVLPDIAQAVKAEMEAKSLQKSDIIGVGVGVPGPVDGEGVVHRCVNLGWGIINVNKELGALLDLPVQTGNDANVAAMGEMWKGGGEGFKDLVVVTLGTGVGGGVIVDGRMVTGSGGAAGEIGHIHVNDDETVYCTCGNKGCLEQYTSATGIVRIAKKKLAEDNQIEANQTSVLNPETVTAKDVWDAVKTGDAVAVQVAEQFGKYLGDTLAAVSGVVNPEVFVIGGGVSKAGEVLLSYIKKYYSEAVFHAGAGAGFCLATLGNDAGIYGAARLVL